MSQFWPLILARFRRIKTSDYNKVRGVIVEYCNKVGLHGKVTITKLYWTALEIPTYHMIYTYSQKTYDDQKVVLEQNTAIHEEGSSIKDNFKGFVFSKPFSYLFKNVLSV